MEKIKLEVNSENYKFFSHKKCEWFPCHDVEWKDDFNCLFCYCPLYALGEKCGGNPKFLDNGVKDCSQCLLPHKRSGYEHIMNKFEEISKLAQKK